MVDLGSSVKLGNLVWKTSIVGFTELIFRIFLLFSVNCDCVRVNNLIFF